MTVSQVQTLLAYRLGESSAPGNATTLTQRRSWIADAYTSLARKRNWWWLEATSTANTNTGSTTGYTEPTDMKEFIELKIDDVYYDQVPETDVRIYQNSAGIAQLPHLRRSYKYYRFGGKYYLIPTDNADGSTHYIKYHKRVTRPTAESDDLLVPEDYIEALSAYAEGRYFTSIYQQDKAVVPFQEYDQIVADMEREQGRRGWGTTVLDIKDPDDVYPYT